MSDAGAGPGELTLSQAMEKAVALQKEGDLDTADELYARILAVAPEYPDAWHFRGLLALQRGQQDEAVALIQRAIDLAPEYADAHNNLGNIMLMAKRYDEAMACYRRAVELRPDLAEAHFNLGRSYEATNRIKEAVAAFRRGLAPGHFESYSRLAGLLYTAGRQEEAVEVYREWLKVDPENDYARHMLASATSQDVPARASDGTVQALFDRFAHDFDEQLAKLQYRAPGLVLEACKRVIGEPAGALETLDAGCGTGLCGPGLAPWARRLVGVDLSSEMVKRAALREVYDELVVAELTAFLGERPAAWDLIVSADTLCYFGDLGGVLAAAATALRPGGHLVFTVERAVEAPAGYLLYPHGRYSHTEDYVKAAQAAAGLTPVLIAQAYLRMEMDKPVPGLVVVGRR
jgi:predicted TPR repeat methyltransferase